MQKRPSDIASLFSSCSGSLTLEASLSLTFFLIVMTSFCYLFLVMQLQIRMQKALEQVSNEAAQYAYLSDQLTGWDRSSELFEQLGNYLLTELSEDVLCLRIIELVGEDYLNGSVIQDGAEGISLDESSILRQQHRIRLVVTYRIQLPVAFLGIGVFELRQQSYRYAWLGDTRPSRTAASSEQLVYVTSTGTVYHTSVSCTYLKLSVRSVFQSQIENLRNNAGAKYYPCEVCKPGEQAITVYITDTGTRYHGDRSCSSIRRDVTGIPISQVGDRKPCSRCGGAAENE